MSPFGADKNKCTSGVFSEMRDKIQTLRKIVLCSLAAFSSGHPLGQRKRKVLALDLGLPAFTSSHVRTSWASQAVGFVCVLCFSLFRGFV